MDNGLSYYFLKLRVLFIVDSIFVFELYLVYSSGQFCNRRQTRVLRLAWEAVQSVPRWVVVEVAGADHRKAE